jgi:hypothetical protein
MYIILDSIQSHEQIMLTSFVQRQGTSSRMREHPQECAALVLPLTRSYSSRNRQLYGTLRVVMQPYAIFVQPSQQEPNQHKLQLFHNITA